MESEVPEEGSIKKKVQNKTKQTKPKKKNVTTASARFFYISIKKCYQNTKCFDFLQTSNSWR